MVVGVIMGKEKVIALFNNKGGVSKTTTTYNLGWMLTELGNKVLMVDSALNAILQV